LWPPEVRAVHEERGVVAFADDLARVGRVQYGKHQLAARFQHTGGFAHAAGQVIGVHEEVVGHDEVETVAWEGQLGRVRHQVGAVGMRLSGGFEQRRRDVDPDDPMATLGEIPPGLHHSPDPKWTTPVRVSARRTLSGSASKSRGRACVPKQSNCVLALPSPDPSP
jgi:hypothetical protein